MLQKEEATCLNNVINRKYNICNCDLFSERPTGFTLCFSDVNAIFQSFFQKFLTVSYRIGFLMYRYIFSISVVFS